MKSFPQSSQTAPKIRGWQRSLQRFFQLPAVEIAIGALIFLSVALTAAGLSLRATSPALPAIDRASQTITGLFVVELSLRFLAEPVKWHFFREYWLDILAVLPLLRVFRFARALQLLRLWRALRLLGVLTRYTSAFPYIFRRGAAEYFVVFGLLSLTILFGSIAILAFERHSNPEIRTVGDAFWFSVYTLFAGEPIPGPPSTLGGRLVAVFVIFMNVTIFAMFTGTVSAFMVERLRTEGKVMDWDKLRNHTIICGWNRKAEIIVREYIAARKTEGAAIVAIAQLDEPPSFADPSLKAQVRFLNDDFTKVSALEKAGIRRARTCIILSDKSQGRSDQDADARTILAALTAEKLNPDVYTCAELINREYGSHLDLGHVNDYVVSEENSGFMLAQAALNRGLMSVFSELLTHERGNQFYRLPVSFPWVGKTFMELFVHLKQTHNVILVAVCEAGGSFQVNPGDYTFKDGDSVIVIARQEVKF